MNIILIVYCIVAVFNTALFGKTYFDQFKNNPNGYPMVQVLITTIEGLTWPLIIIWMLLYGVYQAFKYISHQEKSQNFSL